MKRCPECRRDYYDDSLLYCLDDGTALLEGPGSMNEPATAVLHDTASPSEGATRAQIHTTDRTAVLASNADVVQRQTGGFSKRLVAVAVALAVLALGGFFGYRFVARHEINSIAVLPLQNVGGNPDSEYLSDGLAESLIYRLSQLPNLKVSSASSVMRYKGQEFDVKKVSTELGVQAVLSGRMTQRGDNLKISIELVDAATNNTLWGEQYERKLSDLLGTQREIATTIAEKLQLKLSGDEAKGLTKKYTNDSEAYQLYLKGRFQWNKRTAESLKAAESFYKQAIEKDPQFALAYASLAENYVLYPSYAVASPKDCMPLAKAAAMKAIELDETVAEAHTALHGYYVNYPWNFDAAEREIRRAIELNPNYPTSYHWLGNFLADRDRCDEAITAAKRAEELDPLSPVIAVNTGWDMLVCRRYDEALEQTRRALQLDPNFFYIHYVVGLIYVQKGMYQESLPPLRRSLELTADPFTQALYVKALVRSGQRAEAVKERDALIAESQRRYVPGYCLAVAQAALGEKDAAFALLEKEIADRSSSIPGMKADPTIDDLRDDPRFAELLKKIDSSKIE